LELGLNLYSLNVYPTANEGYFSQQAIQQNLIPGIYFRYGKKKVILRSSLSYVHAATDNGEGSDFYYLRYKKKMNGAGGSAGIQRLLCDGAVQPYFSLDLGYVYMQEKGTSHISGEFLLDNYIPIPDRSFTLVKHLMTFDPAFGIRWQLKCGLVFSFETGTGFYSLYQHDLDSPQTPYGPEFSFRFRPVQQLGIGYRF
jgi:hypothetical protein